MSEDDLRDDTEELSDEDLEMVVGGVNYLEARVTSPTGGPLYDALRRSDPGPEAGRTNKKRTRGAPGRRRGW